MFSRPVSSGWNPVPTSSREAMRPLALMLPVVGPVTLERIFSRVLLPAPFFPMIPSTSPCFTSKLMSFSAQAYALSPLLSRTLVSPILRYGSSLPRTRCHHRLRSWLNVPVPTSPRRYCLERFSTLMTVSDMQGSNIV